MDWYPHAFASVNEGTCPEHRTALDLDGWCMSCRGSWSVEVRDDVPHVVTRYADVM